MNTPTRLGAYGLSLLAAFGAATGVGAAVGPVGTIGTPPSAEHSAPAAGPGGGHGNGGHADAAARLPAVTGVTLPAAAPGGLMVSETGYTLDLVQDLLPAGPGAPLAFRILGPDGAAVTAYRDSHDEDLQLIAVRRDMTGFQHVHPTPTQDGTWRVPLDLSAGTWRVLAHFVPGQGPAPGQSLTLGADLFVAGDHQPQPLPAPSTTAQVEGYTVTLAGQLVPGQESELTLSVSRDGAPVRDLQPYLAAYGHLVALRGGDLAYLHVQPAGAPGDGTTQPGPDITFYATTPSAGNYRLFLDFQHGGVVRTAEFTARATGTTTGTGAAAGPPGPAGTPTADDVHGH